VHNNRKTVKQRGDLSRNRWQMTHGDARGVLERCEIYYALIKFINQIYYALIKFTIPYESR